MSSAFRSAMFGLMVTVVCGCASLHRMTGQTVVQKPTGLASGPLREPLETDRRATARQQQTEKARTLAIAIETAKLATASGMDDEALVAYQTIRRLDPDRPGVSHALAVLHDRGGRADAASHEYRRALLETPNDADVHCDFGYFQYSLGKWDSAETSLRHALTVDPHHHQAKVNLATLLGGRASTDDQREASRLFTETVGPAAAKYNLAMLQMRAGNSTSSAAMLREAAREDPSLSERTSIALGRTAVKTPIATVSATGFPAIGVSAAGVSARDVSANDAFDGGSVRRDPAVDLN